MTKPNFFKANYAGVALVVLLGIAAMAISDKYTGPVMLFAILIGLALHPAYESKSLKPGIIWCARPLLLTGVTLACITLTIGIGFLLARLMGLPRRLAILMSGAIAICGASAAVAISAALPLSKSRDRDLALTVAGVTTLSTMAMIVYPMVSQWLELSSLQAAIFLGASIHDVAQVVGAGYSISDEVGNKATLVKLIRVSALLPVVLLITLYFRNHKDHEKGQTPSLLPPFLIAHIVIAGINSYGLFPQSVQAMGIMASKYCLIISLVAIGLKTDLKSVATVGRAPLIHLITITLLLALMSLAFIHLFV